MNFHDIGLIINVLTLFIGYSICATLAGWFRALVARSMGDSTGERLGYLTLNPLAHMDMIGLIFLLVFGYGWGRYVPINHYNIHEPHAILKRLCASFSDTFMYLMIALGSMTLLIRFFGFNILYITVPMVYTGEIYLNSFTEQYTHYSSFSIVIALILTAIVFMAVMLAVIKSIVNAVDLIVMYLFPEYYDQGYLVFLLSMICLLLISFPLRNYVLYAIEVGGCVIASFLGASL